MIPLDRLRELEQGRACDVNSPDYFAVTSELLHIREMAAETVQDAAVFARRILDVAPIAGQHRQTAALIGMRDNVWADNLAEAHWQYRAAVAESVALIAQVAELKEECARLRKDLQLYGQHYDDCVGLVCRCGYHDALSRGAKS